MLEKGGTYKEAFLQAVGEVGTETLKSLEGRRMSSFSKQDRVKLMILNIKVLEISGWRGNAGWIELPRGWAHLRSCAAFTDYIISFTSVALRILNEVFRLKRSFLPKQATIP